MEMGRKSKRIDISRLTHTRDTNMLGRHLARSIRSISRPLRAAPPLRKGRVGRRQLSAAATLQPHWLVTYEFPEDVLEKRCDKCDKRPAWGRRPAPQETDEARAAHVGLRTEQHTWICCITT